MVKQFSYVLIFVLSLFINITSAQENNSGIKTTTDITIDEVGDATLEFNSKYTSMAWDNFTRSIGTNTSILKDNLQKSMPKYIFENFEYTQQPNDKTNKQKVKVIGMMSVSEDGKWYTDLDSKNPEITKLNDEEYILVSEGSSMKIHLPPGTKNSKVEKDNFNKAILTYPVNEKGGMGLWLMITGFAIMLFGAFLLYKKLKEPQKLKTIYEPVTHHEEIKDHRPDHKRAEPPVPGRVSGPSVVPEEFPADNPHVYNRDAEQ